jgi:hypothetical protein
MPRSLPSLSLLLLLGACSVFDPAAPRPEGRDINLQQNVSVRAACREAADLLARVDALPPYAPVGGAAPINNLGRRPGR